MGHQMNQPREQPTESMNIDASSGYASISNPERMSDGRGEGTSDNEVLFYYTAKSVTLKKANILLSIF